jgi:aminobenzoyl-glutamate transport protein
MNQKQNRIDRFLRIVERGGNALPHPATLFAILALLVIVMSWLASLMDLSVLHPSTGAVVEPVNLLSIAGLHRILTGLITNFTSFAPLGTVLVAIIGIGVAEHSGLIGTALRLLVMASPRMLLTPIVVFAGVMSRRWPPKVSDTVLLDAISDQSYTCRPGVSYRKHRNGSTKTTIG